MSTEEQSENNFASRNHSHTPSSSVHDVNVEASLISSSQLFTTSASLVDCVDSMLPFYWNVNRLEKMIAVLRDGKKIIGVLRSFDQYGGFQFKAKFTLANLVLQDAVERIFVGDIYGDIPSGIYVIRGENVVLLGEIVTYQIIQLIIGFGQGR
jgi:small nuclear ribonucleoprotein (snRNP)-like protein